MEEERDFDISLSVIIPSYNAADVISIVLENIVKVLERIDLRYELLVVNDGSTDSTLIVLQELEKQNSNLKIISYDKNRGKGYAVKTGIAQSRGKWVMFIDSDLDISPKVIPDYIHELGDYDIVIGSKLHSNSKIYSPFSRQFLSSAFGIVVRLFTDLHIRDTQVGLKMGNGDLLRKIFSMMTIDRFSFDVEFLLIASLLNKRIKEMPVMMNIKHGFKFLYSSQMLYDILVISYRYKIKHHYQKKIKLLNLVPKEYH